MLSKFWRESLTNKLISVIILIFFFQNYLAATAYPNFVSSFLLVSGGNGVKGVYTGEIYRLFTSAFLHGGLTHVGFNMLAFFYLGNPLERFFALKRYILILCIVTLGSSLFSILTNPINTASIGASGMIYGLFGFLVVFSKELGINLKNFLGIIAINLALSFLMPGIDWHGHIGGLLTGILAALIMRKFFK